MFLFQRNLMYFPLKTAPSLEQFHGVYKVIKTSTKDQLELTHWYAKQGKKHIVLFHGNAGNLESRAYKLKFLLDQGYSFFLVGYRGYGGNPGRPNEAQMISDSSLALEWLFNQEKASLKETVFFGESLGSAVAIGLAEKHPVKGMIFEGAFSSAVEVGQARYPFAPISWLMKDSWDSLSRISKVKSPLFFIHSKRDRVVPFRFGKKLFEKAPEPKKHLWLEHTDHSDNLEADIAREAISDFLEELFN